MKTNKNIKPSTRRDKNKITQIKSKVECTVGAEFGVEREGGEEEDEGKGENEGTGKGG